MMQTQPDATIEIAWCTLLADKCVEVKNTLGRVRDAEQIADFSEITPPDTQTNGKPELPG